MWRERIWGELGGIGVSLIFKNLNSVVYITFFVLLKIDLGISQ